MAIPEGVCRFDGVGAPGNHKGSKHPANIGSGRGNQSAKLGGSYMDVKEKHSGSNHLPDGVKQKSGTESLANPPQTKMSDKSGASTGGKDMRPGGVRKFKATV